MSASTEVKDVDDQFWPDPLTFPINRLRLTDNSYVIGVDSRDVQRIDALMHSFFSVPEFDDIVLWLNNIPYLPEITLGSELTFPTRTAIDSFLLDNRVG